MQMAEVKRGIQHQTANGDLYEGVYVQHHVGGLTFDTFVGYIVDEGQVNYSGPGLVGTWVYSGDVELSASEESF